MTTRFNCLKEFLVFSFFAVTCALVAKAERRGGCDNLWYFGEQHYFFDRAQFDIANQIADRAAKAGYTGCAFITGRDYFGNWEEVRTINDGSADFVANYAGVDSWWRLSEARKARFHAFKRTCDKTGLDFIPLVWSVGYGSMNLDDPNRVAVWPSRDIPYVARGRRAVFAGERLVGDFSAIADWGTSEEALTRETKVAVKPGRRYRLACELKTQDLVKAPFVRSVIDILCLTADGKDIIGEIKPTFEPTQDWTPIDFGFNAEQETSVTFRFICPDGGGQLSVRNLRLEEVGIEWPVRREGCPFVVKDAASGRVYVEGKDYARVPALDRISFNRPQHEVELKLLAGGAIAEGTQLKVTAYEPVFIRGVQASSCLENPELYRYFEKSAEALVREFGLRKWFLSPDEIRMECRCEFCEKAHRSMCDKLADCICRQRETIRRFRPDAEIYLWSDMVDVNHNASRPGTNYFLCRTPFAGVAEKLPRDLVMVPWYYDWCEKGISGFTELGFPTLGSCHNDRRTLQQIQVNATRWLKALATNPKSCGIMYTTWENGRDCGDYTHLEDFAEFVIKSRSK